MKTYVLYRPVSNNVKSVIELNETDFMFLIKTRQALPNGLKTAAKIALAYEQYKERAKQ